MSRTSAWTRVTGAATALVVLLAMILAPLTPPAHAEAAPPDAGHAGPVLAEETLATLALGDQDPPDELARWWGVLGAIVCGAEIRLLRVAPAIGLNPFVLAAGLGGCILALMDILTT